MKQIDNCFERFFSDKQQLKSAKWKLQQPNEGDYLVLFHYDHMALMIDPDTLEIAYEWPGECSTDVRGIKAAIAYLEENRERLIQEEQAKKIKAQKRLKE